jgi:hypothetical protein
MLIPAIILILLSVGLYIAPFFLFARGWVKDYGTTMGGGMLCYFVRLVVFLFLCPDGDI